MRLARLDLLRFGHFADHSIELPKGEIDLHIVYGPNEAGKSTALHALEDLVFGLPHNSPYNFRHDYKTMLLGAVLERAGETVELRRRKGNKDTVLNAEGLPYPAGETALASWLGAVDRSFFERMFSLDHERLRRGGKEILDAKDEVGQMLFAAASGVSGLRERLKALDEEAEALWTPRRAASRAFYQASDRFDAARHAIREATVTESSWKELKAAMEAAEQEYAEADKTISQLVVQQKKLSRVRRVHRDVARATALEAEIASRSRAAELPADANERIETAEREAARARARSEPLAEQLNALWQEVGGIKISQELLVRADDIEALRTQRIALQNERRSLPKRRAELADLEIRIARHVEKLGWPASESASVEQQLPAAVHVAKARSLLIEQASITARLEADEKRVAEIDQAVDDVRQELEELEDGADVRALAATVEDLKASADLGAQIGTAEKSVGKLNAAIASQLSRLRPAVDTEETLLEAAVPSRADVAAARDRHRELDERQRDGERTLQEAVRSLRTQKKALEGLVSRHRTVDPGSLEAARTRREAGWRLIRQDYLQQETPAADAVETYTEGAGSLVEVYQTAVERADELADRRFDTAEWAAKADLVSQEIGEREAEIDALEEQSKELLGEIGKAERAWQELWVPSGLRPDSPEKMLDWLDARAALLALIDQRNQAQAEIGHLKRQEAQATDRLALEIEALGTSAAPLRGKPLRVALEFAAALLQQEQEKTKTRREAASRLKRVEADGEKKQSQLAAAQASLAAWKTAWEAVLEALRLPRGLDVAAAGASIELIEELRVAVNEARSIRVDRVQKIERDIDAFEQSAQALFLAVFRDVPFVDGDTAVLALDEALAEARDKLKRKEEKEKAIAEREGQLERLAAESAEALVVIREYQRLAGVESVEQLKEAVAVSDRLRACNAEMHGCLERLGRDGDQLSFAEVRAECAGQDFDELAAEEERIARHLEELRGQQMELSERRGEARRRFAAVGGSDAAARAAAEREAALAEMGDVVSRYVRVRTAAQVLAWAIEQYRLEKQTPLLRRAGELFRIVTAGSFARLTPTFTQDDQMRLMGVRESGEEVPVEGMSAGTVDQLYLALRIAAVEEYLDRSQPLPFIADALFINFDEGRAAAGMRALAELAKRTQVIVFTHHEHLIRIGQTAVGDGVRVAKL